MKKFSILAAIIIVPFISFSQNKNRVDSIKNIDSADLVSIDKNQPYDYFQYILRQHDPIMYLTFVPTINPLENRVLPLRQKEGADGYILEGNISHRINIYRGKYYSPYNFLKKLRVTLDAAFNLRMTKDESSPLLPQNNEIGLGMDYLLSNINKLQKNNASSHWLKLQVHHFSNGQAGLSTYGDRNNYIDGDFSTNYARFMVNSMYRRGKWENQLWTIGYGYQRDLDIGGPLTISNHLWSNYGFNRLLVNLQWLCEPDYCYENQDDVTLVSRRSQLMVRAELGYIFGDGMNNYTYQNKYPFNAHLYISWIPFVTVNAGLVFHGYIGVYFG